ncbi:MAG: cytochrome c3 family protein [Gemmatimonadales bacterium]|jgi:hypothetical protein
MIPSRKFLVVLLAVAGTAGLATAAGSLGDSGDDTAGASSGPARQMSPADAGTARADSLRPLLPIIEHTPTGMTAQQAIDAHVNATEGPEQPIPFNHRFHSQELNMQCAYCHGGTQVSPVATIPPVEVCMGCHRIVGSQLQPIQQLREMYNNGQPVEWKRIHKLPDFVQFPHEAHIRNQVACSECHGEVEKMDRVSQVNSLKMGWCLSCHMGEGQETDYATDRLIAAQFPPPPMPEGRQPVGLYPRKIDEEYGAHRGPIDCTVCHY